MINALLMDEKDNVVTCVVAVNKGNEVSYMKEGNLFTLTAEEDIPYCHKIAISPIAKDDYAIKYGEIIGKTTEAIEVGHWVSDKNIYSVPRDYENEYIK